MVGTIYTERSGTPQSFRYASLSIGLDIVHKTLDGHRYRADHRHLIGGEWHSCDRLGF
jgi:hypothetical protein